MDSYIMVSFRFFFIFIFPQIKIGVEIHDRAHVPSSHSPILLARSRYEKQWQGALSTMLTLRNPTLMHTQYLVAYPIPSMPRRTEAHWAPCCKARWLTASIICIREIILAPLSRSRRRIQVSIGKLHHT